MSMITEVERPVARCVRHAYDTALLSTVTSGKAIRIESNGRQVRSLDSAIRIAAMRLGYLAHVQMYPDHVIAWLGPLE